MMADRSEMEGHPRTCDLVEMTVMPLPRNLLSHESLNMHADADFVDARSNFPGDIFVEVLILTLIKLKLLLDVRTLRLSRPLLCATSLPTETVTGSFHMCSCVMNQQVYSPIQMRSCLEQKLIRQCQQLEAKTCNINQRWWLSFFQLDGLTEEHTRRIPDGNWDPSQDDGNAYSFYAQTCPLWWRTEGLLELLTYAERHAT